MSLFWFKEIKKLDLALLMPSTAAPRAQEPDQVQGQGRLRRRMSKYSGYRVHL